MEVSPPVRQLRHPARDRLWSVGEQRPHLPIVRGLGESGHCASSRRLGTEGRPRMALLASPDVGIHRRALLKKRERRGPVRARCLFLRLIGSFARSCDVMRGSLQGLCLTRCFPNRLPFGKVVAVANVTKVFGPSDKISPRHSLSPAVIKILPIVRRLNIRVGMKTKLTPPTFSTVLLVFAAAIPSQASVIHVPGDQPTIQAGINAAVTADTVLVDPGTYFENINFNGKAITVRSGSGAAVTLIDGGNVAPVATFSSGETPSSVLSRFTLQHGTSTFETQYMAGGVYISSSSPTISDNIIRDNTACGGGGGIAIEFGSPRILRNTIQNNTQAGCSGGIGGGGISVGGAGTAQIIGNVISDNAWPSGDGGGISLFASGAVTIRGNVITGNSASG